MAIKCYKCGNEYAMGMMRMDPNGKNLACRNCIERKPVQKQETKLALEEKTRKSQKQEEPSFKEYFCRECRYNFKRARHLAIKTCPYCGSGNIMTKGSTARIMADAFRMKGD